MTTLLPFGTQWPLHGVLGERASRERETFRAWVAGLGLPAGQERVLAELLGLMDDCEFVEGRAACVVDEAELVRRTGLGDSLGGVLEDLVSDGLVTSHAAGAVFNDDRPGLVLRVRRPDVVLTVEAAGPLWVADSWIRKRPVVTL